MKEDGNESPAMRNGSRTRSCQRTIMVCWDTRLKQKISGSVRDHEELSFFDDATVRSNSYSYSSGHDALIATCLFSCF